MSTNQSLAYRLAIAFFACLGTLHAAVAQTSSPDLTIRGTVPNELRLTLTDLKQLPRTSVTAKDHGGATHTYEGVALQALLAKAGAPQGGDIRGNKMTLFVLVEAGDGYRAVFSLAELDADFSGTQVLVADTADGKPLAEKEGPLRLVVPGDKRPARWVRMLKTITVATAE
jgi:DMSO/TMAO reductase YedYZ molybdopterin-dependent catalytic subunit